MKKRNLFAELTEGVEALADERQGKQTLGTAHAELRSVPTVTGDEVIALRSRLKLSRTVLLTICTSNQERLKIGSRAEPSPTRKPFYC